MSWFTFSWNLREIGRFLADRELSKVGPQKMKWFFSDFLWFIGLNSFAYLPNTANFRLRAADGFFYKLWKAKSDVFWTTYDFFNAGPDRFSTDSRCVKILIITTCNTFMYLWKIGWEKLTFQSGVCMSVIHYNTQLQNFFWLFKLDEYFMYFL